MEMTAIKLNQLKRASEAYKEQKAIYEDLCTEDMETSLPPWAEFRDSFLADWNSNRIIVDEKEADAMFDKTAEEALAQIEAAEGTTGTTATTGTTVVVNNVSTTAAEPVAKKRGRPAGTKAKKSYTKAKTKAVKTAKATKKVAKAKKAGGTSKMDLARATVEKFVAKKWERKDIIARLVEQNGLSPAYAATAYQKIRSAA